MNATARPAIKRGAMLSMPDLSVYRRRLNPACQLLGSSYRSSWRGRSIFPLEKTRIKWALLKRISVLKSGCGLTGLLPAFGGAEACFARYPAPLAPGRDSSATALALALCSRLDAGFGHNG